MSRIPAFLRQDFLTHTSYRVQIVLSLVGLVVMMVPLYFIANALQSRMAESIEDQGGQYFAFLMVGIAAHRLVWSVMNALPAAVQSGIRTGTLEALFSTPTRLSELVSGMMAYKIVWGLCEGGLVLVFGWALGASFTATHAVAGVVIALLIVLSYVPFGLLGASGILAFRTAGPLMSVVHAGSVFLGGVYYPTHVIPTWLEDLSSVIPLTYGLRALRMTILEGAPLSAIRADVSILLAFTIVLSAVAMLVFMKSLNYARRAGSLAQY